MGNVPSNPPAQARTSGKVAVWILMICLPAAAIAVRVWAADPVAELSRPQVNRAVVQQEGVVVPSGSPATPVASAAYVGAEACSQCHYDKFASYQNSAHATVHLQGTFPQSPAPSTSIVIDQQGCVYYPRIQGARVGQTLEVKNSDATLHNIHSMSTKGMDFNVGQPLAGMVYKYQLKTEEMMLHVKCDVHSWMTGYVGVVSHPYFAVTDATGTFTIANVPLGKHTLRVWHEQYGALTQTVDVKAGGATTVEFAYTGNEKPSQTAFAVQELVVPVDAGAVQLIAPSRPDRTGLAEAFVVR